MKNAVRRLITKAGYSIVHTSLAPSHKRDTLFELLFASVGADKLFFVQIGACDGVRHDPIYPYVTKYNIAGVAVEPLPLEFYRLEANYKPFPRVGCANVAIGKETGALPFYTVDPSCKKFPTANTSISSFDRRTLKKNIIAAMKEGKLLARDPDLCIQEVPVKTLTFPTLIQTYRIARIDFLQIDCEGYDYEILKDFDFSFSPKIINFESVHLSPEDKQAALDLLVSKGYTTFDVRHDTCAYKI